ncbi:MAG: hypothetical protein LDL41_26245, partial [Coleofasciculus sp. S288]|nr:hypothetical protein [Coleofasciculus sp. S288]
VDLPCIIHEQWKVSQLAQFEARDRNYRGKSSEIATSMRIKMTKTARILASQTHSSYEETQISPTRVLEAEVSVA